MDEKHHLRVRYRKMRDALPPEYVATASQQVCDHIAAWPPFFQRARTVMAYLAFRNEVDLGKLLAEYPDKHWVVPRVISRPQPALALHPYDPARLVRHAFGMWEPDPALPLVDPQLVDLVLAPGLAFDRRGFRLGLGGGFYDRFLPHVRALKVGVTYSASILDSVPADAHDQPMDCLACEEGILPVG